ncbi:MAG: hypothetical protein V3W04_02880 [Gammaproteobacteria bacterium]
MLRKIYNLIIYAAVVAYTILETFWEYVSDVLFTYTPLRLFSIKIHDTLENKSEYLILAVFILHFVAMEAAAIMSGKAFLSGNIMLGLLMYLVKGILAVPVFRFFTVEKEHLLKFKFIRVSYELVTWIKSSEYFIKVTAMFKKLKAQLLVKVRKIYQDWC